MELANIEKNDLIKYIFVILFIEILFVTFMIFVVYKLISSVLEVQKMKMENYIDMVDKYVITSSTDLKGKINYVSEAFCAISGYTKEELIGKNHNIVRHEDMPKSIYEVLWSTIKKGNTWVGEIKNKTKDGGFYWVKANISPLYEEGKHIGYMAVREDITSKKKMEELSVTDPLTGLYNRRKFHEVATNELARVKREIESNQEPVRQLFFILLDVDHFKQYNDNYGHDQGDVVLQEVAKTLQLSLKRATDFAFRLGGEEFGILIVDDNLLSVKKYAQMIRESIENMKIEHCFSSCSSFVTASLRLSVSNEHFGFDLENLYQRADKALYKSKELGRNKVETYMLVGKNDG
jgi:diguanylate cyclase (GGDEF)-like protein/PAS domain S-box-containing protein